MLLEGAELADPARLILKNWLVTIDEFTVKINLLHPKIEQVAATVEEEDILMSSPTLA